MEDADKVHVVLGASGGTGTALVRELVRRGRRVRAVNRSGRVAAPPGVETMAGDAGDPNRMREVCQGAGVVYNAVNPPFRTWREDFPAVVDGALAGAAAADARMVFVDDTWMYGRVSAPMTEDLAYRPVSDKGVLRAWLAERILGAHASGRVRAVIGRAPELYGPGVESLLAGNVFGTALAGRRAVWIGALDEPLGPMFIDDFAHGLADLGEHEEAPGQVWHLPTPAPTTARRFIETVFAAAGGRARILQIGPAPVRALGLVWPIARAGAEMLYQFRQPHSVDAGKYRAVIGAGRVTSYDQGIASTLDWYRSNPPTSLWGLGR